MYHTACRVRTLILRVRAHAGVMRAGTTRAGASEVMRAVCGSHGVFENGVFRRHLLQENCLVNGCPRESGTCLAGAHFLTVSNKLCGLTVCVICVYIVSNA